MFFIKKRDHTGDKLRPLRTTNWLMRLHNVASRRREIPSTPTHLHTHTAQSVCLLANISVCASPSCRSKCVSASPSVCLQHSWECWGENSFPAHADGRPRICAKRRVLRRVRLEWLRKAGVCREGRQECWWCRGVLRLNSGMASFTPLVNHLSSVS